MKIHLILLEAVIGGLKLIFEDKKAADKVIEQLLKANPRWGARDRGFVAETMYDMVRHWRLLWCVVQKPENFHPKALFEIWGIYHQLFHTEMEGREKEIQRIWQQIGLTSRFLPDIWRERYETAKTQPEVFHSFSDWMHERAKAELGEEWEAQMVALNQKAKVILRVNTLKTTIDALQQQLAKEFGIETDRVEGAADALVLQRRVNLFQHATYQAGLFEIQDANSQLVASFLNAEAGMRVIDACAGAGGKTLHLAALMQNRGKIISLDVEDRKLQELQRRAKRAGANIIETKLIENHKTIKRLTASADRLLLDVPCSGIGVLRRNPDAKWKLSSEFLAQVQQTQQEILRTYSKMLKPEGQMVYATCSILPSENQQQVVIFLAQNPDFELIEEKILLPSTSHFDGFYMAKLGKKEAKELDKS
ncbi:MAG: RsmB/NOP family class I SAM-dependent RNA methyltransferase [Bacteroidia bacterium]